jgi:hypothetical protein
MGQRRGLKFVVETQFISKGGLPPVDDFAGQTRVLRSPAQATGSVRLGAHAN